MDLSWQPRRGDRAERISLVLAGFTTGGSERIGVRLANGWAEAGRRVTILCGRPDGPLRATVSPRVRVLAAPGGAAPGAGDDRLGADRARLGRAFAAMLAELPCDVAVSPGNYHVPVLAAVGRALGPLRPALVSKLSNPIRRAARPRLAQALFTHTLRWRTRGFDRLVAMSPALAAEAVILLGRDDVACAPEPLVDGFVAPAEPPRRRRRPLVVAIGRLAPQKNFALALDAFARLRRDARLAILGEGAERPALRARAETLGIGERVYLPGHVANVPDWLAEADALLATSRFEGYPAVLLEALSAGVPIVTTPSTLALPEIMLDPSFGRVAPADPGRLADALGAVLDGPRVPEAGPLGLLRRRHGTADAAAAWAAILDEAVAARAGAQA